MKFEEVCQLRTEKKLSTEEAAEILGVCSAHSEDIKPA